MIDCIRRMIRGAHTPRAALAAACLAPLLAVPAAHADDAWSDPATWNGAPPVAGDHVVIDAGRTVILDVDPPALASLTIRGGLVAADGADRALQAGWIMVDGGTFTVGTPDAPFAHRMVLTLDGPDEDVGGMGMGGRFLVVRGGGTLDLHGHRAAAVDWAVLDVDAAPGTETITLDRPVDWRPGDRIAIAPSGYDARETEAVAIVDRSADGRTLTIDPPLAFTHLGSAVEVAGRTIDMRAEVGLLSRDLVIQAPADAVEDEFGFHGMFMVGTTVRLSGVEFVRGGQIRKPGRYPVHWHLADEGSDDWIRSCSIHESFQRGVVVHGTSRVTVEDTVVHDVWSHAFVPSEDGWEIDNVFRRNLAMLVKRRPNEDFSFPRDDHTESDQAEHRPAGFWYRNYHQIMIDNRAAGSVEGNGFFVDSRLLTHQAKQFIKNDHRPIVFHGNRAHSNFRAQVTGGGIPTYGPKTRAHGLLVHRYASEVPVVFNDFTAYKNSVSSVWIESDTHVLDGAVLADSSIGVFVFRAAVRNVFFVQQSPNTIGGEPQVIGNRGQKGGGFHLEPTGYGGVHPRVDGVTLVGCEPAAVFIWQDPLSDGTVFRDLTLIDTPRAVYTGLDADGIDTPLLDADGSLAGHGPALIGGPTVGSDPTWDPDIELWWVPAADACAADRDGDGVVGITDLLTVLAAWGTDDPSGDVDGDGGVTFSDLALVLGTWGRCG